VDSPVQDCHDCSACIGMAPGATSFEAFTLLRFTLFISFVALQCVSSVLFDPIHFSFSFEKDLPPACVIAQV
jgi:hypothetical protein